MIAITASFLFFPLYISPCVAFVSPNPYQNVVQRQDHIFNPSFREQRNNIDGLKPRDLSLSMVDIPIQDLVIPALLFSSAFVLSAKPELLDSLKEETKTAIYIKNKKTLQAKKDKERNQEDNTDEEVKSSVVGSNFLGGLRNRFTKKKADETETVAEEKTPVNEEPEPAKSEPVEETPEPVIDDEPETVEEKLESVEDSEPAKDDEPEPVDKLEPVKDEPEPMEPEPAEEETDIENVNISDAKKIVASTLSGEEEKSRLLRENVDEVVDEVQDSEETTPVPEPTGALVEDNVTEKKGIFNILRRILKKIIMPWKKFSDIQ